MATDDPVEWCAAHLRNAWPVLVPRIEGEPLGQWMNRVSDEHVAASKIEIDLFEQMGGARLIGPGEPYPVMSPEYQAAGDRVQVLPHQLAELRERVTKRWARTPRPDLRGADRGGSESEVVRRIMAPGDAIDPTGGCRPRRGSERR